MPEFTAAKLFEEFARAGVDPDGASVAVLGVAYRPGVQETRASPALPIIERLTEAGVDVHAVDPVLSEVPGLEVPLLPFEDLTEVALDGVVLVTAHPEFDAIDWTDFDDLIVVDGRDALDLEGTSHTVTTLGRGG
jgi:UDP-N-acetyl-D-mannosaminuronic acid dehydrogenase